MKVVKILFILCFILTTKKLTSFNMPSLNNIKNHLEQNAQNMVKLTKENLHEYVKFGKDFVATKENIESIIITPEKILLNNINNKLSKFNWCIDIDLINLILNNNNNNNILNFINNKIINLHPNIKFPILSLGKDIQDEVLILEESKKEIQDFIEKEQKLNTNRSQENLINNLNKIIELEKNLEIIASYINTELSK
ncbi:MAG: hypothetical protein SZ59_C0006G0023 [candidate division TM6 bacterium GW2011_GWF2_28_16]|jgi:ribosomal protein L19|nr:MAG: hypothetical protein SZ59_C0006G0023 [candidate division TM6 bacterium GW2011_GWF2_28_16]